MKRFPVQSPAHRLSVVKYLNFRLETCSLDSLKGKLCCQLSFLFCQKPNPSPSAVTRKIPDLNSGLDFLKQTQTSPASVVKAMVSGLLFLITQFSQVSLSESEKWTWRVSPLPPPYIYITITYHTFLKKGEEYFCQNILWSSLALFLTEAFVTSSELNWGHHFPQPMTRPELSFINGPIYSHRASDTG